MASVQLREKARLLRQKGQSISNISTALNASKSTVSYWCRNIALTNKQMRNLAQKRKDAGALGRLRAAEKKRAIRIEAVEVESKRGARAIGSLSQRDIFVLGIALYWGEGYKSGNEECGFTNSDPDISRASFSDAPCACSMILFQRSCVFGTSCAATVFWTEANRRLSIWRIWKTRMQQ